MAKSVEMTEGRTLPQIFYFALPLLMGNLLQQTYLEAEDGKDVVYTCQGKRLTQRGTPDDSNATVWQLLPDGEGQPYNFLYENNGRSLTLLNSDFKRNESSLNFTLNKVE